MLTYCRMLQKQSKGAQKSSQRYPKAPSFLFLGTSRLPGSELSCRYVWLLGLATETSTEGVEAGIVTEDIT